jgi:flagellar biosynthesis protein FlhG
MSVEDQADALRRLMHQARQTRTIAVTSGKGGVGKSNVALNLAILLAGAGNRVALVDADMGLANLDLLAGVSARTNISHVVAGRRRLADVVVDLPCGVQFVPGASGLAKLADLSEFQRAALLKELSTLEADNDVIVVDTGAGIGPDVLYFSAAADSVLVVTSPEPTAVTDGYAVVKILAQQNYNGQISLLVNMAGGRQEARDTHQRVAAVARRFLGVRLFDAGYVVSDARVRDAVRKREPFVLAYPRCPASRCMAALATKLSAGGALVERREGFFKRVATWFA